MRLAHFGTFDVRNYGDLLFPLIVEAAFPDAEIVHISPVGGQPYLDVPASTSLSALAPDDLFDAVIVGGGNLIHARPTTLPAYSQRSWTTYPDIWAGAAQLAARQGIPLGFNAPGIARKFGPATRPILRKVASQAAYFSVRDTYSRKIAESAHIDDVAVVPDTALSISKVVELDDDVLESHSLVQGSYLAVHLNERYISRDLTRVAATLDRISEASGRRLVLLAIGPCHGDDVLARRLGNLMETTPVVVDDPSRVTELATLIARSAMYLGASLHGFITATSFGVPARIVAPSTSQHKFRGLLEQLDSPDSLLAGWNDVLQIDFAEADSKTRVDVAPALASIERHWQRMRTAMESAPGHATFPLTISRSVAPLIAATNFIDDGWKAQARRLVRR